MQAVPLKSLPAQVVTATLGGQGCSLKVYQRRTSLFLDLYVDGVAIVTGVACRHGVRIVRDAYLNFAGDLAWIDTQGQQDPEYTAIGSRWTLIYLEASDL